LCPPYAGGRGEAAASARTHAELYPSVQASGAPTFPCGSACAAAVAAEDSRNAATAAVTIAVALETNAESRDRSAAPALVRLVANPDSAAASRQHGAPGPADDSGPLADLALAGHYCAESYYVAPGRERP